MEQVNETSNLLIAGVSYLLGVISGFSLNCFFAKKFPKPEKKLGNTLVLSVVTLIWAFSVIFDMASPSYETSPMIHALMGAIVGFFYKPVKEDNGNGKNDEKKNL